MTTLELIREKREEIHRIAARHGVTGIRVFGSVARDEAGPESDVDFLVEVLRHTPWFPPDSSWTSRPPLGGASK